MTATFSITVTAHDYRPIGRTRVQASDLETALVIASITAPVAFPDAGHLTCRAGWHAGHIDLRDGVITVG